MGKNLSAAGNRGWPNRAGRISREACEIMAAFTDFAINANNYLCFVRLPVEKACLLVKKLFSRTRSRRLVAVQWCPSSPAPLLTAGPPHEIISCRIAAVRVKKCHIHPLQFCHRVVLEVAFLVKLVVVYRDRTGQIGVTRFQKEFCRQSQPLPGALFMSGAAGVTLDLVDCRVETRPAKIETDRVGSYPVVPGPAGGYTEGCTFFAPCTIGPRKHILQ